ncbi:MAG: CapA family protein [Calditrichia bacterium]
MPGSWGIPLIREEGMEYPFKQIKQIFENSDLNMCNLEVPVTTNPDTFPNKTFHFKIPPDFVQLLHVLPIHYVTLANNHILDYQVKGLLETMDILNQNKVAFSGAGQNLEQAARPVIIEKSGYKVGIIAAGAIFPKEFWATDTSAGIFFPWKEKLIHVVDSTRKIVDLLFVTFHWGAEKRTTPKNYQISLAHQVIKHGADVVWGHHPHVIQGIEFYRGKPIFYSLGNFIFASYSKTQTGMVVKMKFVKNNIGDIEIIPLELDNDPPLQPSVLTDESRNIFIKNLNSLSDSLNSRPILIGNDLRLKF